MTGGIGTRARRNATCGEIFKLSRVIAIFGMAAVAGCAAPATAPPEDEPIVVEASALRVSSTHGLVRDALDAPVAGARVEAHPVGGAAIVACTTTGRDGRFTLQVHAGSYDIVVKPRATFSPQRFPALQLGSDTLELRLALSMELTTTQVSGRLLDRYGNPLTTGGLGVCGNFDCVAPDADGGFVLNLVVGQPPQLRINGFSGPGGATGNFQLSITNPIAADGSVGDVVLPLYALTVQVVGADGAPVIGANLISTSCYPVTADGLAGQFCAAAPSSDAGGVFHFVVPPGTVPLLVPGALGPLVQVPVTSDTNYTINLPSSVLLSGLITDSDGIPQDGASTRTQICVKIPGCMSRTCLPSCTMTDGAGRYQLRAAVGDYEVDVSSTRAFGGYSLSQTLSLRGSEELDLTLPKQQLTGHVLDGNDAPVPAATVFGTCYPIAVDGFTGTACPSEQLTDGAGAFSFTVAAPGTTTFEVKGADATAQTVTVGTDSDINVRFAAPALLNGQLLTGDAGVPGAYLCFLEDSVSNFTCLTTDANGQFQLSLLPSTYHVFTQTNRNNTFLSVDFHHFTVSSAPITLRVPPLQQLAGRLVGVDGQPLVGAPVHVNCQRETSDGLAVEYCGSADLTDAGGGFSFLSMQGIQQDLEFQPPNDSGAPWVTVADVTAGGSATFVTVALQPPPGM
ncbi:MAG TPA: carboxypeptidase-like regulatory domain-containing protein [Polyangia bacterium]|jgi:hypothetical protein|nr:carboxypeptidase-like regulatory domain-containing protein [Polyangia bacterium]